MGNQTFYVDDLSFTKKTFKCTLITSHDTAQLLIRN